MFSFYWPFIETNNTPTIIYKKYNIIMTITNNNNTHTTQIKRKYIKVTIANNINTITI